MPKRPAPLNRHRVLAPFPRRPRDSHKGLFGTVFVVGGADGMLGAALMAGRAALKCGAGRVHVGLLASDAPAVNLQQPELMLHRAPFPAGDTPFDATVVALGCGLGRSPAAQKLLHDLIATPAALVLDADALNLLARRPDLRARLHERTAATVLTPHPAEAARLLGCDTANVQTDRQAAVLTLSRDYAADVVLKGADSLIATGDGKLHVNKTGNPGMSCAGMGDVLTGMVAAFLAQGMAAGDALRLAVHLHGAAGDALAEQQAAIGMSADEITTWARFLLNRWLAESAGEKRA